MGTPNRTATIATSQQFRIVNTTQSSITTPGQPDSPSDNTPNVAPEPTPPTSSSRPSHHALIVLGVGTVAAAVILVIVTFMLSRKRWSSLGRRHSVEVTSQGMREPEITAIEPALRRASLRKHGQETDVEMVSRSRALELSHREDSADEGMTMSEKAMMWSPLR
jgi:hypothetical protein